MGKPIPVNRRWNPDEQNQNNAEPQQEIHQVIRAVLEELTHTDGFEDEGASQQPITIPARFEGICRACFEPIHIGQAIARRDARLWVHLGCLNRPALPPTYPILYARRDGLCPLCGNRFPIGTPITRYDGYWVHAQCAIQQIGINRA